MTLYAEILVDHTKKCQYDLHRRAIIQNQGSIISFDEAINLYYNDPEIYFPWSFPEDNISLKRTAKTYKVYQNELYLGDVIQSHYDDSSVRMLDELIYINAIQKIKGEIKDCSYFYLTSKEYDEYVQSDPYNRGYPSWADSRTPKIKLFVYFEDGVINLADFNTGYKFPEPKDFGL